MPAFTNQDARSQPVERRQLSPHKQPTNNYGPAGLSVNGAQKTRTFDVDARVSLPEGWVEVKDPKTGKPYYVETATKKTQWARPEDPKAEAPAAEAGGDEDDGGLLFGGGWEDAEETAPTQPSKPNNYFDEAMENVGEDAHRKQDVTTQMRSIQVDPHQLQSGDRVQITLRGTFNGLQGRIEKALKGKPGKYGIKLDTGRRLALHKDEFQLLVDHAPAGDAGGMARAPPATNNVIRNDLKKGDRVIDADGLPGTIADVYPKSGTCWIDYDDKTYDTEYKIRNVRIEQGSKKLGKNVRELVANMKLNAQGGGRKGAAGLRFVFTLNGWRIKEIMQEPGQPDLRVGDVIIRINGHKLMGVPEERQHEIFRGNYENGAKLTVVRKSDFAKKAVQPASRAALAMPENMLSPRQHAQKRKAGLAAVRAASRRDAEERRMLEKVVGKMPVKKPVKTKEDKEAEIQAEMEAYQDEWSEFTAPLWHSAKRDAGRSQGGGQKRGSGPGQYEKRGTGQSNYRGGRYNAPELDKSKGDFILKPEERDQRSHYNMLYGTGKYRPK